MKNEKSLTLQQLALYLGCDCMVDKRIGRLTSIDTQRYPSIIFDGINTVPIKQFIAPERIKLILTPLSEIDSAQLISIASKYEYDAKYIKQFIDIPALKDVGTTVYVVEEEDFRTAVWILNELRALGYDCDDLIEQGLAIDKTKI